MTARGGRAAGRRGGKAAGWQGGTSWLRLIAIYIVLVGLSKAVRSRRPMEGPLDPGERLETVRGVDGDRLTKAPVRIAYLDHPADRGPEAPTVVLIHGSPGDDQGAVRPHTSSRWARSLGRGHITAVAFAYKVLYSLRAVAARLVPRFV